jgi:hypothetical protein
MHPAIAGELARMIQDERHREAVDARRVAAARRARGTPRSGLRRRAGLALVRWGEAIAGPRPAQEVCS